MVARVETPEETYARRGYLIDLIAQGLTEVAAVRHAMPGAERRRSRHANVFSGDIRADLIDWLEPRLPGGVSMRRVANSGVELQVASDGFTLLVRRPDSGGHAPPATSDRRRRQYSQLTIHDLMAEREAFPHEAVPLPVVVATWDFSPDLGEAVVWISAPSGAHGWHWLDVPVEPTIDALSIEVADEEDEDPLAGLDDIFLDEGSAGDAAGAP